MFDDIRVEFDKKIAEISTRNDLIELKNEFFSKKGKVTKLMANMRNVEDKKVYGEMVNTLKQELYSRFTKVEDVFIKEEIDIQLKKKDIDMSLPSRKTICVNQNILIKTAREIEEFFESFGFEIAIDKEVESDYYNFEALNLGKDHPARDMQDSFYISSNELLRTHTSNIQSRVLENNKNKELKIICPGKVFRRDDDDATHSHQFMQLEGLCIVDLEGNNTASLRDLKTILSMFVKHIFNNEDLSIRLRPSYFPFTEPSVEVDVSCSNCLSKGCSICKQSGWIEVLGAGIIDKNVLEIAGYDTKRYSGYAFGIGIERITMLKYNIEDIRNLYINDERFNKQF